MLYFVCTQWMGRQVSGQNTYDVIKGIKGLMGDKGAQRPHLHTL